MRVLRRELGVAPGAATRELFERIFRTEAEAPGEQASKSPVSPLKPVSHLEKFRALVGRETEWQQLASAWQAAVEARPKSGHYFRRAGHRQKQVGR